MTRERIDLWPLEDNEVAYSGILAGQVGFEAMDEIVYSEIPAKVVEDLNEANLLTSRLPKLNPVDKTEERYHQVAIDLDHPARLIPSTTEGHHHLLINVDGGIPEESYFKLLDALAECQVIEKGYAEACQETGFSTLRLPWIKKGGRFADGLKFNPAYDEPVTDEEREQADKLYGSSALGLTLSLEDFQ